MKRFLLLFLVCILVACKQAPKETTAKAVPHSKLIEVFKASHKGYPNISVHRGGKGLLNYPENCLETIKFLNDSISAVYEVDVAQTKDGQLVLLHDNAIDRTTTGSGKISDLTYAELQQFNLIDDFGNKTDYKIPLFSEVLTWCSNNNVILTIDIKRSVSQKDVINAIRKAKAEDISLVITYDLKQARMAYELAPDLLLSVPARNHDEFDRLLKSGIPTKNMIAFTGTRLSDQSLFQRLHDENIVCILGTLGNLDNRAEARGEHLYRQWIDLGADILATDRPFEAFLSVNQK
ncbi:glycerophosphoryl diester phosphodiesterase [Winogradskyella epiphytica]|uniref:Glycerophosphoryl diester phosphodiesterase n=1 Tax=Winogradskyella epiphytica TaxID=262005 RepID=A0A2V4YD54_9FLAO|nr:glycerophosphodiester phosphodiesterase family protein [Winogradskyella epiphytica]PYE81147.1 glycerophosphoryl diester phosphodiesterase [Winogradskyella epiphytica]GGW67153.1 glycerophosphoryl diester phosphodiesterase [Winogradskyella epiphytica]